MASRRRGGGEASTNGIALVQRKPEAVRLRIQGMNYREIAAELGVSVSTAHETIMKAVGEYRAQTALHARDLVTLELARCDALQLRVEEELEDEDCDSAAVPALVLTILKVMERRAKLLGLDAPTDVRLGGIPSAPGDSTEGTPIPGNGPSIDVTKLATDELRFFWSIFRRQQQAAQVAAAPPVIHDGPAPGASADGN